MAALLLRIDDALQLCAYVDLVSGRGFHTEAYTSPELREVRQNSPLDIVLSLAGGASIVGGALYMGAVRFIKLRSRWIELKRQESEADSEQRIRLAETDLKLLQLQRVTMDMVRSEQDRGRLMQRADGQWAGLATVLWTSESISLTGPDGEVIASSEGQ
ncbi:hypothetical protein D1871_04475 [Nakamurella silvestris]|nr:hypothetical protein D1871_04475 [Nakamurella silvestris]